MMAQHPQLPYYISDQKALLALDTIQALLHTSYWAADYSRAKIEKSIQNSLCFGIYHETGQVGFARVISDYATFSWICDVIIDHRHRGQGLGKWFVSIITSYPQLTGIRMLLGTRDAHELYAQFGFENKEVMFRK
ncbi:GNAT family N-acetyltransferase [Hazenella sp. IB182357]|uniref:GNAT family N-acetyltransferase n=2 Tax=Polycladospora coralii TaxID=2771432 RepID=A0A926NAY6_9BACL|nr:GNAT family N-acetyltransferase [Polycladospora coralii]MBD1371930.1 GNAT family N-acetyltransferase [Polycladospora coralii]